MTGQDLVNELSYKTNKLDNAINQLAKSGRDYASAYTNYRVALAQELLKLKNDGYAITLAGDIARGRKEIASLKFKEIETEALYKANLERINALKLEIKLISNQIDKEWNKNE